MLVLKNRAVEIRSLKNLVPRLFGVTCRHLSRDRWTRSIGLS